MLSNPKAQNLVDLLIDEVCAQWMASFDVRQPSTETQQKFWDSANAILVNLMRAKCSNWPTTIGMYRSKGALDRGRRYRPSYMTAKRFITVQDCLMRSGHIEMVSSGFNLPGYSRTSRFALTEAGARALQADRWTYPDFAMDRGTESIRLRDKNDRLCGYDDTPETEAMRARLNEINTKLDATRIATTRQLVVHDRKPEYQGRRVRLHRIFGRGGFEYGGRFYGGWWQNIRSHARATIMLDGQHTIEADFRGFNPAVLLSEAGQPIPEDPYARIVGVDAPTKFRDHAKTTLAAFLNSKSGTTEEPRNFDSARWGMTAEDFRQKVLDAFPMVPDLLATDKGMILQRLEADLAEAIMLHFVRQGHAILPIHDAFIVQAHLERELVQVMEDTFKARLGKVPNVKVTRSYALR